MSEQEPPVAEQSWPAQMPVAPVAPSAGAFEPVPMKSTSGDAIVAFILSLASWAFCPIILAVVALIFAMKADRAIDAAPGQVGGSGLSLAAKLIAWINIGFWVALIVIGAFIGVVLLLAGAGTQPSHP